MSRRHDLIAVSVSDPREHELPDAGLIELEDAETGALITVDTGSASVRRAYAASALARAGALREALRSMDIDLIEVGASDDYLLDLIRFFKRRERQKR
jgi:uncharacterized protein (DUF58 family)